MSRRSCRGRTKRVQLARLAILSLLLPTLFGGQKRRSLDAKHSALLSFEYFGVRATDDFQFRTKTGRTFLFHVTKESAPVSAFGGVATVVGDLSFGQSSNRRNEVVVILPRYGFIENHRVVRRFQFILQGEFVKGEISILERDNVTYVLVSAPSTCESLWLVQSAQHAYDIPRVCSKNGFGKQDRDLYFGLVSAQVVGNCHQVSSLWDSCDVEADRVVLIHSAHNVPTALHLQSIPRNSHIKIVYVIHDYNNEPYVSYSTKKLAPYVSMDELSWTEFLTKRCPRSGPFLRRVTSFRTPDSIHASQLAACASVVVLVSKGMLKNLLSSSVHTEYLIRTYTQLRQLVVINNWVSTSVWTDARVRVPTEDPVMAKAQAQKLLFRSLRKMAPVSSSTAFDCLVLWIGRFDQNKGIVTIPRLVTAACDKKCAFAVMGHGSADRLEKHVLHDAFEAAKRRDCPIYLLNSARDQELYGSLMRAAADIVVVTSAAEAFGLVAAESLAYAALPVVSAVGGLPELVIPYSHESRANWTGITFEMHARDWRFTSKSAATALSSAITLLRQLSMEDLYALQARLIKSAPVSSIGVQHYEECINTLLHTLSR